MKGFGWCTLSEQLLHLVQSEAIADRMLGNNDPRYVRKVSVVMPSGRGYMALDVLVKLSERSLKEAPEYISRFAETLINDNAHPLGADADTALASPLVSERPFRLKVLAAPLGYEHFVGGGQQMQKEKSLETRSRSERILDVLLGEGKAQDNRSVLIEKLGGLLRAEFGEQATSIDQAVLSEIDRRYLESLNAQAGEVIYRGK